MIVLERIISGGQTGVDQVGLFVARELGYRTGGTAPKGWRTDEGPAPWLADYGLVECYFNGYRVRTWENVQQADGTVWFGERSPGYFCTIGAAIKLHKVHVINPTVEELRHFLDDTEIEVLNVAGNRKRTHPEASERARAVLVPLLARTSSDLYCKACGGRLDRISDPRGVPCARCKLSLLSHPSVGY